MSRNLFAMTTATLLAIALSGCNGNGSPTSPDASPLVLTQARISVNGQTLNGRTLAQGHGEGRIALFEADLEHDGVRVTGGSIIVRHTSPGGGMMMGPSELHLYDDGTHGDRNPGDGHYCFEDTQGQYGCHTSQAPRGSHHYDFMGSDGHGRQSNQTRVTVTIE
jgi:hypothetical protein